MGNCGSNSATRAVVVSPPADQLERGPSIDNVNKDKIFYIKDEHRYDSLNAITSLSINQSTSITSDEGTDTSTPINTRRDAPMNITLGEIQGSTDDITSLVTEKIGNHTDLQKTNQSEDEYLQTGMRYPKAIREINEGDVEIARYDEDIKSRDSDSLIIEVELPANDQLDECLVEEKTLLREVYHENKSCSTNTNDERGNKHEENYIKGNNENITDNSRGDEYNDLYSNYIHNYEDNLRVTTPTPTAESEADILENISANGENMNDNNDDISNLRITTPTTEIEADSLEGISANGEEIKDNNDETSNLRITTPIVESEADIMEDNFEYGEKINDNNDFVSNLRITSPTAKADAAIVEDISANEEKINDNNDQISNLQISTPTAETEADILKDTVENGEKINDNDAEISNLRITAETDAHILEDIIENGEKTNDNNDEISNLQTSTTPTAEADADFIEDNVRNGEKTDDNNDFISSLQITTPTTETGAEFSEDTTVANREKINVNDETSNLRIITPTAETEADILEDNIENGGTVNDNNDDVSHFQITTPTAETDAVILEDIVTNGENINDNNDDTPVSPSAWSTVSELIRSCDLESKSEDAKVVASPHSGQRQILIDESRPTVSEATDNSLLFDATSSHGLSHVSNSAESSLTTMEDNPEDQPKISSSILPIMKTPQNIFTSKAVSSSSSEQPQSSPIEAKSLEIVAAVPTDTCSATTEVSAEDETKNRALEESQMIRKPVTSILKNTVVVLEHPIIIKSNTVTEEISLVPTGPNSLAMDDISDSDTSEYSSVNCEPHELHPSVVITEENAPNELGTSSTQSLSDANGESGVSALPLSHPSTVDTESKVTAENLVTSENLHVTTVKATILFTGTKDKFSPETHELCPLYTIIEQTTSTEGGAPSESEPMTNDTALLTDATTVLPPSERISKVTKSAEEKSSDMNPIQLQSPSSLTEGNDKPEISMAILSSRLVTPTICDEEECLVTLETSLRSDVDEANSTASMAVTEHQKFTPLPPVQLVSDESTIAAVTEGKEFPLGMSTADDMTSQLKDLIDGYKAAGKEVVPPSSSHTNPPENLLLAVIEKKFESLEATLSLLSGSVTQLIQDKKDDEFASRSLRSTQIIDVETNNVSALRRPFSSPPPKFKNLSTKALLSTTTRQKKVVTDASTDYANPKSPLSRSRQKIFAGSQLSSKIPTMWTKTSVLATAKSPSRRNATSNNSPKLVSTTRRKSVKSPTKTKNPSAIPTSEIVLPTPRRQLSDITTTTPPPSSPISSITGIRRRRSAIPTSSSMTWSKLPPVSSPYKKSARSSSIPRMS